MITTSNKFFSIVRICFLSTICFIASCRTSKEPGIEGHMETGFRTPPDSVKLSAYWYWINGNISVDGVTKDIESMQKAGIGTAFIGNIGLSPNEGTFVGKVKLFSDDWWNITRQAFIAGDRAGVEIGLFNGPGWSQSGGPWVKPSEAMRYLAHTEMSVTGPVTLHQQLPVPDSNFQRTSVIAFPSRESVTLKMRSYSPNVVTSAQINQAENLVDGNTQTEASFFSQAKDSPVKISIQLNKEMQARSLLLFPSEKKFKADVELQAKEGDEYKTIKTFQFDRSNPNKSVGFLPYAPVAISFPAVTSREFRLVFSHFSSQGSLSEIELSATPYQERYIEKQLAKMFQAPQPMWKDYEWPQQSEPDQKFLVDPDSVINIIAHVSSTGMLNWDAPEGEWTVMQTGMLPTGVTNAPAVAEGTGLEVDKMNKEALASHFNSFIGKIITRIPAVDRKAFKYVVADSYETGSQNWTDGFAADFKKRYGYDPLPWLPVLAGTIVASADQSDRFLWDLRRLVADRVAYSYVGGLRDLSHQHGLKLWLENYGHWGFPAEFLQYGGQSDELGGEFWAEGDLGSIEIKAASSAAHTYGKNKVSAESFTAAGKPFQRYPGYIKKKADWAFTQGVNNTLLHVYISQPQDASVPGVNAWFGTEFNRNNTWFDEATPFFDYMRRCMYMLQQGHPVQDVAYFIGEDAPKMTGIRDPELPEGYSYDYINAEVIENRLTVADGKLVLPNGIAYSLLVLPPENTMRPTVLKKIVELVSAGAVVWGPRPDRSPSMENYPSADKEVKSMAAELWQNCDGKNVKMVQYGKGMVLDGMSMEDAFSLLKVIPDFKANSNDSMLYTHRKTADTDIYFVSNQSDSIRDISPEFRVADKQPEWWDASDGSFRDLPNYILNAESVTVPIKLVAHQSGFIIFRKKGERASAAAKNFPGGEVMIDIQSPWEVAFDTSRRGPAKPVQFEHLDDWSKRPEDEIKYYSGTATYHNSFNLSNIPKNETIYLDLGNVKVIADVTLNGKSVGGVWTAPWKVDITSAVKEGQNDLKIKVVNTWVNRLIGDSKLPPAKRETHTDVNVYDSTSPLESSGLLGPITITAVRHSK